MLLGSAPFSILGVALAWWLKREYGDGYEDTAKAILGTALVVCGIAFLVKAYLHSSPEDKPFLLTNRDRAIAVATGVVGGFVVGLTSVGSGTLFGLVMLIAFPLTAAKIVGTDIFHAAILLAIAGAGHLVAGHVDLAATGWLLIGSVPGVLIGGNFTVRLPDRALRIALASTLTLAGVKLVDPPGSDAIVAAGAIAAGVAGARRRSALARDPQRRPDACSGRGPGSLELLAEHDRTPPVAHASLPERNGDRAVRPRVQERDRRAALPTPVLRLLDEHGRNSTPTVRLRRQHRTDEQASLAVVAIAEEAPPGLWLLHDRLDVAGNHAVHLRDERKRAGPIVPLGRDPLREALSLPLREDLRGDPRVVDAAFDAQLRERVSIVSCRPAHRHLPAHGSSVRPCRSRYSERSLASGGNGHETNGRPVSRYPTLYAVQPAQTPVAAASSASDATRSPSPAATVSRPTT